MTVVIHQSSKWYLDSWPPQNTLVLPCFGMFLLRFQPVVKTNIKTWHIKTQLKPKNWSTDEGGDHDQHDETQEENQDIGSAAGEVRLGPHCINRQRHLRTATVEECVAGGEVYQDATSMVNSYGYGSKFEAYGTTHVSICLVLTIWLLEYLILTHGLWTSPIQFWSKQVFENFKPMEISPQKKNIDSVYPTERATSHNQSLRIAPQVKTKNMKQQQRL